MPRLHRATLRSVLPPVARRLRCLARVALHGAARAGTRRRPPTSSVVDGDATLERDGRNRAGRPRTCRSSPGDRLRTGNGRVEIAVPGRHRDRGRRSTRRSKRSRRRACACWPGTMDHVQGATAATAPRCRPPICRRTSRRYGGTFDQLRLVAVRRAVRVRLVSARSRQTGGRTTTATGRRCRPTAGRGSASTRWSWPTHHYGRWGYARNAWFWIPGRTWGAAWVSWASAPTT